MINNEIPRVPSVSTEYIKVHVIFRRNGLVVDPTGYTVNMAFVDSGEEPSASDWISADWETESGTETRYYARGLIGPSGSIELSDGTYDVWVKFVASPEEPARKAGSIKVT